MRYETSFHKSRIAHIEMCEAIKTFTSACRLLNKKKGLSWKQADKSYENISVSRIH